MQEVFEKIIEKLEELRKAEIERDDLCDEEGYGDGEEIYEDGKSQGRFEQVVRIIEIVKQEAEQYNNGWISCSERLPEGRQDVLVCFDNTDCCIIAWYSPNGRTWRNSSTNNICKEEPIAWMNLPAPYQPKG